MIDDALKLIREHEDEQEITEIVDLAVAGVALIIGSLFGAAGYFKGRRDLATDVIFDKYSKQSQEADANVLSTIGLLSGDDRSVKVFKSRREFSNRIKKIARVFSIIQRSGRQELINDARLAFVTYLELTLELYKKELPIGQKSLVKTIKTGLKSL